LSHAGAKIERREKNNIRDGEAIARDVVLALELTVQPLQVVLHRSLHSRRALRNEAHAAIEKLLAFREAKAVVQKLGDFQLDAALPHACLRALFGIAADEGRIGMLLFEVFPNRDRLADILAVVEFERGKLSAGVAIGVRGLAIFALHQVHIFARNVDSLLGHEHAHRARIGSKRII